jgi:transcription initiation factor TFIIIB Brf1 subunit/transcription initiation factor TFIIB
MSELDQIWNDFEIEKQLNINNNDNTDTIDNDDTSTIDSAKKQKTSSSCKSCKGTNLQYDNYQIICFDCGLIFDDDRITSSQGFETTNNTFPTKQRTHYNNKLTKMQEWYMWSNEEKNIYKLKMYIKELCEKLVIPEYLLESIISTSIIVMESIKRAEGTKRARVKDGILVACIHYVTKDTHIPFSYIDMAKKLKLDIKYITKAERMILELINSKRLNLDKKTILETKKPYDYIVETINKHNLKISQDILKYIQVLIQICEDNDILLDHTPLSVGASCFYYILKLKSVNIDLKVFSEFYNLSMVTVIKTFNKLKVYENQINEMLLKYTNTDN